MENMPMPGFNTCLTKIVIDVMHEPDENLSQSALQGFAKTHPKNIHMYKNMWEDLENRIRESTLKHIDVLKFIEGKYKMDPRYQTLSLYFGETNVDNLFDYEDNNVEFIYGRGNNIKYLQVYLKPICSRGGEVISIIDTGDFTNSPKTYTVEYHKWEYADYVMIGFLRHIADSKELNLEKLTHEELLIHTRNLQQVIDKGRDSRLLKGE